ncbi:MAG: ABC transporter permease [Candidatus Binatia bacterium]
MTQINRAMDAPAVEIIDPGRGKWWHYISTAWENIWPLLCLFILWEILARSGIIHTALFPTVSQVVVTIYDLFHEGILIGDIVSSLSRVLFGGLLACLIGTIIGLIMGTSRTAEKIIIPPLNFFLSIPGIATFPIVILFLGLTETTLIVTLGFEAGLTVLVNTWTGVKSVPPNMLYAGRVLGAKGWPFFRRVLFPAALPSIITGYRLGFSRAWRVLVGGELLVALGTGLGYRIFLAQDFLQIDVMYAGVLLIGVFGFLLERVVLRSFEVFTVQRWGMLREL